MIVGAKMNLMPITKRPTVSVANRVSHFSYAIRNIVDEAKNVEARGQGIANIVSSLFGGMAGCALVGQSVMNTENGGRSRLSTFSSGLSLLAMILLL